MTGKNAYKSVDSPTRTTRNVTYNVSVLLNANSKTNKIHLVRSKMGT